MMGDFDDVEFNKSAYNDIVGMCAWHYYGNKILKLPTTPNPYATRGSEADKFSKLIRQDKINFDDLHEQVSSPEVAEWVCKGIAHDPYWDAIKVAEYQKHVRINEQGERLDGKERGYAHGYLDQVIPPSFNGTPIVVDWKTVFDYSKDDPCERDTYALFGFALFPEAKVLDFTRFNLRYGVAQTWTYEHGKNGLVVIPPEGEPYPSPPILQLLHQRVEELRSKEAKPNPGNHCENYYGVPCDFLGTHCPLAKDIKAVVADVLVQEADNQLDGYKLEAISKGEMAITPQLAPRLLSGALQLKGFLKALDEAIKNYSRDNGPIPIGDQKYGFSESNVYTVDKVGALTGMVQGGMSIRDIAKIVTLTASDLKKANLDQWPEAKEVVEASITFKNTRSTFGPME